MEVQTVDYNDPNAAEKFVESLRNTGFGVLKNHPIPKDLVSEIYANWQSFFNDEGKSEWHFNRDTQDGYFPPEIAETAKGAAVKDIKEFFHIYPWGKKPPELAEQAMEYYALATELAAELLSWVEQHTPADVATGYSVPLSQMIADTQESLLRVLHYPPLSGSEEPGAIRAAAHEDINLLTILPSANAPGLQVLSKTSEWLDVPCDFGTLIINTGDMLQEASGGYFPSTTHRVINPEQGDNAANKSRISLPLFLHPRPEIVLSERYTARSYLDERLAELGIK